MNKKRKGIIYILSAAFSFALMNLFIRLAGDLPVMQKAFFRNFIALLFSAFLLIKSEQKFRIKIECVPSLFYRSITGFVGVLCNFYAISNLNISDATMLNKLSPFFAMIFSAWILREKAIKRDWIIVLIAFIGAMFVVKPTMGVASYPALIGVMGGLMAGLAYTYVRKLGIMGERSAVVVFFFAALNCLIALPFLIINFSRTSSIQLFYLLLASCAAMWGQFSINAAYTNAPAKDISVFDYAQVVIVALLGFLFLSQIPDMLSVVGYIIIASMAFYKWFYDRQVV